MELKYVNNNGCYIEAFFENKKLAFDFSLDNEAKNKYFDKLSPIYFATLKKLQDLIKENQAKTDNPLYINALALNNQTDKFKFKNNYYWDFDISTRNNWIDFHICEDFIDYNGDKYMELIIGGAFHNNILNIEGVRELLIEFIVKTSAIVFEVYNV